MVAGEELTVLNLFRASVAAPGFVALVVVVGGRVVGRVVVVDVRGAVAGFVAGRAVVEGTVLGRDAAGLAEAPVTLDLRSNVEVVGLVGARVEGVPASDIRLAVPEIPRFSSLELATDRDFSSAELPLTEARARWEAVLGGLRTEVVEVVGGRVGGLLRVEERAVVGLEADDVEVGRLETGLEGEALTFSLLLPSGLVRGPSLPDTDLTGVGGAFSPSGEVTGSEAMV